MDFTKVTSTRLAFASFLMGIGSLILVNPYQFYTPEYAILHGAMDLWGVGFIMLGATILTANLFHVPRWIEVGVYTLASLVMLLLAAGFASTGFWIWVGNYTLLGIFCLISIVVGSKDQRGPAEVGSRRIIDLFALFMGLVALLTALVLMLTPESFEQDRFNLVRPQMRYVGLLALSASLLLFAIQIRPNRHARLKKVAYLWTGLIFIAFFASVPLRYNIWPGRLFYGGFGLLALFMPWSRYVTRWFNNPSLLYTRLTLLLILTMAAPLVMTVTLMSKSEERTLTATVLEHQQHEASVLAEAVNFYIGYHRAALRTLAEEPLQDMQPAQLAQRLVSYARAYPDVLAFSVFSREGELVARSDGLGSPPLREYEIFTETASTLQPASAVYISPSVNVPVIAFSEPLFDTSGTFSGIVMVTIDSQQVSAFINRQGDDQSISAYLVDEQAKVISHPDNSLVRSFANLSGLPQIQIVLNSIEPSGSLIYGPLSERMLIGYARVPQLRWNVITENPASIALAAVQNGSDLAYIILLVFLVICVIAGVLIAREVARPLTSLNRAATELAAGNNAVPLPTSTIVEIRSLADAFHQMRLRLQQRTLERERAEQALRLANEELEERVAQRTADLEETARALQASNSELQDFAYIASHDLQEPLRKIQAFGDRLRTHSSGDLNAESLDSLTRMLNAAERMQKMINDLLTYSRITTKAQPLAPIDLTKVVRDVLQDLDLRLEQTGGSVEVGSLPSVKAEPTQMHQLFQNLIANALKFHRPGVPPVVRVACEESTKDGIKLVVEDNGIGFETTYAERIFLPFQRLHGRGAFEGNGIGLAICRKIVERHGGQIHAESTPGQGSRFIIALPRASVPPQQGEMK